MIQTEINKNIPHETPEMTRTRCPGCQKLFAVETSVLTAMSRAGVVQAEFTCTGSLCRELFALALPLPKDHTALTVLPALRISKAPGAAAKTEVPQDLPPAVRPQPVSLKTAVRALTKAPPPLKTGLSFDRECPRCGAMNSASEAGGAVPTDCVRCGIIFDRYTLASEAQLEEELALGGTRELAALWDKALEDYEDRIRHDRFLNACRDSNALSYAAKKYSQILVAAPQDDIARLMRNRVVALVSSQAESTKLPINLGFRIPKMNSMALFGGSLLFFWGLAMPQLKNVMEIGLSLVLLSIGVRLALRARI